MTVVKALTHSGTHWDAEKHLGRGGRGITDYPLETFIGDCVVIDVSDREEGGVVPEDIEGRVELGDRVLFKTRNSRRGFRIWDPHYAGVTGAAAVTLQEVGVRAVDIDSLSIRHPGEDNTSHEVLLQSGIPILEGINLSDAEAGRYMLSAAPLPYTGLDGAPTRAVLMRFEQGFLHRNVSLVV